MKQSDRSQMLEVCPDTKGFSYWLTRPYVSTSTRAELARANTIILPWEGFRDHTGPVFPGNTDEVLDALRDVKSTGFTPDICIDDAEYKEVTLHAADVFLPDVLVQIIAAPLLVQVLAAFLTSLIQKRDWTKQDTRVHFTLLAADDKRVVRLKYDGPAESFEKVLSGPVASLAVPESQTTPAAARDGTPPTPPAAIERQDKLQDKG